MLFTEEELDKDVVVKVRDLDVVIQLISRLNSECRRLNGAPAIADAELGVVGTVRQAVIGAIEKSTGKNYDALMEAYIAARQRAQEAAAQAPAPAPQKKSKK